MSMVVGLSLLVSLVLYLWVGYRLGRNTHHLADLIPLLGGKGARVANAAEFSASTVATTVSLATIIIAYFELVPYLGLWLLWTAVTTAAGIGLLVLSAKRIWQRMSEFDHRPSLHEFLGRGFSSPAVALAGAVCTSVGFLLVFAVELTVGSRFLAALVPEVPQWVAVCVLSLVGFGYTAMGGFRAVIRTDYLQMRFIWLLLVALGLFFVGYLWAQPQALERIPVLAYDFSYRPGLGAFLVGIALMNVPTHLSNMSIWQRIAASENPETVFAGLRQSVLGTTVAWVGLVLLAVLSLAVVSPAEGENLLTSLLYAVVAYPGGYVVVFFVGLGLYGAMLSTASTQLIAVSHTIYEDIWGPFRDQSLGQRLGQQRELKLNRIILFLAALVAVLLVELLGYWGFSVADLVFAIYGGQLALFPLIVAALFLKPAQLLPLQHKAIVALLVGFVSGWGLAFAGKWLGNSNLVFLAPVLSIVSASAVLGLAWGTRR